MQDGTPASSPKLNCWEFNRCGREPGGALACSHGICPAAIEEPAHGINGGENAGRICWAVSGTFCGGRERSAHVGQRPSCMGCDFFERVLNEEGEEVVMLRPDQKCWIGR